ncbi:MAG TPA: indolepyruvate ferredoxin oxidoreductase, partial [Thermodesulfobacteriota bacterium]|nr:indolepyruvate ferredoxin oxidoreductase [Thermodesulfobacteriota bacterium]
MGQTYSAHHLAQLRAGRGAVLDGDGALVVLKALLQSGVAYLGGYPGAPTSSLIDAMASAYEPVLKPLGIYFEASGSEANAAALLAASVNHPVRGAVNWKVVGTNVAADALAHVAHAGVTGGALVIVGEDYGCNSTLVAETTLPYAIKSTMVLLDPKGDLQHLADLVEHAFAISEASQMPAMLLLRTRVGNLRGRIRCKDNVPPPVSTLRPLERLTADPARLPLPPQTFAQERAKAERRLPAARAYARRHRLNELRPGADAAFGIISHGMLLNTTLRCLYLMGEADLRGASRIPILNLHLLHPLDPEELAGFMRDKRAVLVVEEGLPALLEEQVRAAAQRAGLGTAIFGKELLSAAGEYTPELVLRGLAGFLAEVERRQVAVPAPAGAPLVAEPAGVGAGGARP